MSVRTRAADRTASGQPWRNRPSPPATACSSTAAPRRGGPPRLGAAAEEHAVAGGDGLFLHGCPEAVRSAARVLTDIAEQPSGPDALAAPCDLVLMNEKAAFVLQSPDDPRTYYH